MQWKSLKVPKEPSVLTKNRTAKFHRTMKIDNYKRVQKSYRPKGGWIKWGALNTLQYHKSLSLKKAVKLTFYRRTHKTQCRLYCACHSLSIMLSLPPIRHRGLPCEENSHRIYGNNALNSPCQWKWIIPYTREGNKTINLTSDFVSH